MSKSLYQDLNDRIAAVIPGFQQKWKLTSFKQLLIAVLLWAFNPRYLTHYISTMYPVVWWSQESEEARDWKVLAHEFVHLSDQKRAPRVFPIAYLMPQLLAAPAVLSLLGFLGFFYAPLFGFFTLLFFLPFLAPMPSSGRVWAELRGYTMSMAVEFWTTGRVSDETIAFYQEQFTGWAYYKMSGSKPEAVRQMLRERLEMVRTGAVLEGEENAPFRVVHDMLKERGLLVTPVSQ